METPFQSDFALWLSGRGQTFLLPSPSPAPGVFAPFAHPGLPLLPSTLKMPCLLAEQLHISHLCLSSLVYLSSRIPLFSFMYLTHQFDYVVRTSIQQTPKTFPYFSIFVKTKPSITTALASVWVFCSCQKKKSRKLHYLQTLYHIVLKQTVAGIWFHA